jgi:hypothetical protein
MASARQDRNVLDGVARLRRLLDDIDDSVSRGDALHTLELAEGLDDCSASILWSATASARSEPGTTWAVIGGRLGITRQAAHQRLGAAPNS